MILPLLVFCSRFHKCVSIYPINKRFKSLGYWEWHLFQNAEQIGHKDTNYKSGIEKGPLWTSFWVSVSKYGLFFLGIFYVGVCCYQNNVVNKFETLFKITLSLPLTLILLEVIYSFLLFEFQSAMLFCPLCHLFLATFYCEQTIPFYRFLSNQLHLLPSRFSLLLSFAVTFIATDFFY